MALILSIETSTTVCSVAIHESQKLIAVIEIHQEYSHASKLATLVDEVARLAGIKLHQLNAVAVSSGPGSYTGLRIGTSLAKGLCYALEVPLVAVNALMLLAYKISSTNTSNSFLCPMIDARRMEVYCQVFDFNLVEKEFITAKVIDEHSFENYLDIKPVIFFGSGAEKSSQVIIHDNARFLSSISPSAIQLGEIAFRKYEKKQVEDLISFVPLYLKEFFVKKSLENLNEIN